MLQTSTKKEVQRISKINVDNTHKHKHKNVETDMHACNPNDLWNYSLTLNELCTENCKFHKQLLDTVIQHAHQHQYDKFIGNIRNHF